MKRTFITFSCIIATLFSSLSGTNSTFEGPTTATSSAKLIISNDPILPWFNNANLMSREYNYGGGSGNQLSSVTTSIFMAEAGTITFTSHMRSESESSDSRFLFYIDNIEKYQESDAGVDYIPARTNTFNLSAGYHTLKWTYVSTYSCSISIYDIYLTGKANTIDPSSYVGTLKTFEGPMTSTSSAKLLISNDPYLPWSFYASKMARRYQDYNLNGLSTITSSVYMVEPGTITLTYHMLSQSESSDSRFKFYIDNILKIEDTDGGSDYIPARTRTFNLSAGHHTFKWTYNPSSSSCGIDIYNIELTGKAKTIDPSAWDGTLKTPIQAGSFYQITNASEFAWFINQINNGATNINGSISNDLNINYSKDYNNWQENPPYNIFPSAYLREYKGILYGNGFNIKGLYLGNDKNALFKRISGASIFDITLTEALNFGQTYAILASESYNSQLRNIINKTNIAITSNLSNVGAIVGAAYNTSIRNCINEGEITFTENAVGNSISNPTNKIGGIVGNAIGCQISSCTNNGTFLYHVPMRYIRYTSEVGGIVGEISNTNIYNSTNNANFESEYLIGNNVGGIVGLVSNSECKVVNSRNNGNFSGNFSQIGGISGKIIEGTIDGCTNFGKISSTRSTTGGITGIAENSVLKNNGNLGLVATTFKVAGGIAGEVNNCDIINNYNNGEISAGSIIGGITGQSSNSIIKNCYNKAKITNNSQITVDYQGSIIGFVIETLNLENNYYLVGSSTKNHLNTTAVSNEDFENGKLAILLNQGVETTLADPTHLTYNAWGQKIENNGYPVHSQNKRLFFEINSDFTLNYNAEVDDLIINPKSTLKLASNNGLTIVNYLTNNGNFILEDNATLITLGEISGNGKSIAEKNLTGNNSNNGRQWWYISSPVTGATTSLFNPTITYSNKFGYFDETSNPPNYVLLSGEDHILEKGRGYVIQLKTTDKYNFQGSSFNTGNITLFPTRTGNTASQRGFNLIGNPYPSYVNWNSVYQHLNTRNIRPTIWYRTYAGSANTMKFKTYNALLQEGIEGVTGIIPPFQGFWLKVDKDGENGLITFQNSMRSHIKDSSNPMKAPAQENKQKIRMQLSNGINSDEILIVGTNEASDFIDLYDSEKISNNTSEISELFLFVDNEELSINAMNDLINKQIQIGIRPYRSGTFKLSLTEVSSINEDCIIELTDLRNNYKMTITDKSEYNFYSDGMTDNNRFLLEIKKQSITTNNQNVEVNSHSISVNQNNQICIFHPSIETAINSLMITDIFGKLQNFTIERNDTNTLYINHRFSRGIYIVHSEYFTQKIVIN